ncbi:MAG: hypothetical protein M3022_12805 [Actinomycetota bacterium]|nr:hypothetical protein [Actinomycetota bacterium]
MKVLVLTSEPVSTAQLRDALPGDADPAELEVMLVAPALHESALRFWVSDADEAISRADAVRRESVEQLGEGGVAASGDTGEGNLIEAAQDALSTFAADRVVVFSHPSDDQLHGEDVATSELRERLGLPVDRAVIRAGD